MAVEEGEDILCLRIMKIRWLIRRQGDEVKEGKVLNTACYHTVEVGFWDSGQEYFSENLWYCQERTPPSRLTEGKSSQDSRSINSVLRG